MANSLVHELGKPDPANVALLLNKFDAATATERHEGFGWYSSESAHIVRMTPPDLEPERALVAAAIMSPQTKWEPLMNALPVWLRDPTTKIPALGRNVAKARKVLDGSEWLPDFKRAPKTHSFGMALLGHLNVVVLDIWMFRALAVSAKDGSQWKRYTQLVRDVRAAAAEAQVAPREFQAVVWTQQRGASGDVR